MMSEARWTAVENVVFLSKQNIVINITAIDQRIVSCCEPGVAKLNSSYLQSMIKSMILTSSLVKLCYIILSQ